MKKDANIAARFGERVRELRKAKGLSQEAFAAACGLDRTYISGIERGRRNVSLRNIEVIANSLDISLSELMKGL
jgi:transcriptional regulator with XRE-family HTH domain